MKMNNKNTRKAYAYGSMVRKPMQMGGNMSTNMNPMMPRAQQSMPEPITPMSDKMDNHVNKKVWNLLWVCRR